MVVAIGVGYGLLFPHVRPGMKKDKVTTLVTLARLKQGLEAFHQEYGHFPTGNVATVSRVLFGENVGGQNPKKILILNESALQPIDSTGQILDSWGQPIRLEATNAEMVTIFSLGRNRTDDGGRGDDMVVRAEPPAKQKP